MTVVCAGPDTTLGVAFRLSEYLDCQARALGENGFQALAGGALGSAALTAMVTIFIALIGYRMLLGHVPDARDGVGWAVRLGIVLALVTSWPAFQALVYRVAVDAPPEVAAVLLPASGLAGESLAERVQAAYDTMRIGVGNVAQTQAPAPAAQPGTVQPAAVLLGTHPKTASLLVISTMGLAGALRIAIGFLLAVAPLAIMSLLFRGTNGLFVGWVRALAGAALGLVAATIVTAIHLVAVESELAHLVAVGAGQASATVDTQALTTVVMFFALVAVITTLAAIRMGGALRLPAAYLALPAYAPAAEPAPLPSVAAPNVAGTSTVRGVAGPAANARAAAVAEVLTTAVHREQRPGHGAGRAAAPAPGQAASPATARRGEERVAEPLGVTGRRSIGRRTLSAARRDRIA